MAESHTIVCVCVCIFFIHSSVGEHLDCFQVLAWTVNSAAMNTGLHVFFKLWFYLDMCPVAGLLDDMVVLFLVF